jgi:hypothetical protein
LSSTDGIYKIHFDGTEGNANITYDASNWARWLWLSTDTNEPREWVSHPVAAGAIKSSPIVANLDGNPCLVFGSEDGKVYAIHADGSDATGWTDGISLPNGDPVTASLLYGKVVVGASAPQVIAASTDGNVYALWKDGTDHGGEAVAETWTCTQSAQDEYVRATPAFCSLNGTTVSLIVGSTDGIYKIDLYDAAYQPGSARWPWPTFHYDTARTGCRDSRPAQGPLSASVIGKARKADGTGIAGVRVEIRYLSGGSGVPAVANRPGADRVDPVFAAGNDTENDEANEGGFVINQLPVGAGIQYRVTLKRTGYADQYRDVTATTAGLKTVADVVY